MTLSADSLSMNLETQPILRDVTLDVTPGEVVTVVGPSGTGKTTLLRLLAAFRRPTGGTVTWNGTDIWALGEADRLAIRRRWAMVFQEPSLFNASVSRNVTYGLRVRGDWRDRLRGWVGALAGSRVPDPVARVLSEVGLESAADRNALSLSGGEAQRVAFARAMAVDPDILFLDEPTSNLDPRNTDVLEAAIRDASDRGVGVLVATHDMHQAQRISDRVGFLLNGELVELSPARDFFESPSDDRTRRFINGELVVDGDGPE